MIVLYTITTKTLIFVVISLKASDSSDADLGNRQKIRKRSDLLNELLEMQLNHQNSKIKKKEFPDPLDHY